ncbi:MAG: helix-turn-helix domain-containing protein [Clostridia bacterium]|nr:helix-turn-helix domain-containing protein [Clostridia bacterium]
MDYLSGKQASGATVPAKTPKLKKSSFDDSTFSSIYKYLFNTLSQEQKLGLSEKFISPSIVAVMKDKELIDSINSFLKNNLNISETSRNAFLHRNTLLYRIEKINKITGLNVRNFDDAISFKFLTLIYETIFDKMGKR